MKYVVSKFNDDGNAYPVYECEDEEEAMKTAYACNGVYEKVSPSLTDDQRTVLEALKVDQDGWDPFFTIWHMMENDEISNMPTKQQYQVIAAFAEWGNSFQNGNNH